MWITRHAEKLLQQLAGQFPAVLVTGARQVGKTALVRHLFPEASYLTLDYPAYAEAARTAPEALLERHPPPVIIDEIQYEPSLLRYLKLRIDRDRTPGQYLLTGSQLFPLMQGVSESLAGRCGLLHLHTLGYQEVQQAGIAIDEPTYLFRGGYPELYTGADPELWYPAYVATYLERDVRNVLHVVDLQDFHRFVRICALRTAQVVNYSELARDTGIAPNTARRWLNLLQTSAIVALVEPYFGNRTKRLIKAPKLVFWDTGLAAFLAGFLSTEDLFVSPYAGAFWETHVFGQLARFFAARGYRLPIYFWRIAGGAEVDWVIERTPMHLIGVECKWKERPSPRDTAGLQALEKAEAQRRVEKFIVCRTPVPYRLPDGTRVVGTEDLLQHLETLLPG